MRQKKDNIKFKDLISVCTPYTIAEFDLEVLLDLIDEIKSGSDIQSIKHHGSFVTVWIRKKFKKG